MKKTGSVEAYCETWGETLYQYSIFEQLNSTRIIPKILKIF